MKLLLVAFGLLGTSYVYAQSVPALSTSSANNTNIYNQDQPLSSNEQQSLRLVNKWKNGKSEPITAGDGAVTYFYGQVMPSVVCAPLHTCDIQLQAGEQISENGVNIGDKTRWFVSPALSGTGTAQVTHLIVKPSDAGLETTMVVTTNRRTYNMKLVSRRYDFMPTVNFDYPEDVNLELKEHYAAQAKEKKQNSLADGTSINSLDFDYDIDGDADFKPVRVYNNGIKTIVEMPSSVDNAELPSLLVVNGDKQEIVNYRYRDHKFIVDMLPTQFILIMGVGDDQQSVLIKRKG
ncbi:UNVERIFIED_CONTAM: hypothetical protein GTU68_009385 [Idotea baltica]|nr:hypothetical protein [Idotea baltica]